MPNQGIQSGRAAHAVSRAQFLRTLGLAAVGLAAGCTPVRILLKDYPAAFDHDRALAERTLHGFVTAVIPGAPEDAPNLVRIYFDEKYPFARYAGFFAADLCRRAERRFGTAAFGALDRAQRTRVIEDGLSADAVTKKLYEGAVFLAQISFYPGIYDDAAGCGMIGYGGSSDLLPRHEQAHPRPERFLAAARTGDGNFA